MKSLTILTEALRSRRLDLHKKRTRVILASAVLVCVVVYQLILPASTLSRDEAAAQGGIDLGKSTLATTGNSDASAANSDAGSEAKQGNDSNAAGNAAEGAEAGNTAGKAADNPSDSSASNSADGKAPASGGAGSESKDSEGASDAEGAGAEAADASGTELVTRETKLTAEGKNYTVSATCGVDAELPADTALEAARITSKDDHYQDYCNAALAAVREEAGETAQLRFVRLYDISLLSGGEEVEPAAPVSVKIAFDESLPAADADDVHVVHFTRDFAGDEASGDESSTDAASTAVADSDAADLLGAEIVDSDTTLRASKASGQSSANSASSESASSDSTTGGKEVKETTFEANAFSVYAVVYTVDFHYDVDGKTYEYSMAGGSVIGLKTLLPLLGVVDGDEVSQFISDIDKAEFSNEELALVKSVEQDTTAGELIKSLKLDIEYSADLTEADRNQNEAQQLTAGDYAFISLKPFDTDEMLTVTMKTGEVFEVHVTDGQNPVQLDTSGLAGKITVNLFDYYGNNSNHDEDNLDSVKNHLDGNLVSDGINKDHDLKFMAYGDKGNGINHFTGGSDIRQGIVDKVLHGGYPELVSGKKESLDYLFTESNGTGKLYYGNVQGLLYKANQDGSYNPNGSYYSYDSDRYYAYLNNGTIQHHKADIKIEKTGNSSNDGGSTVGDGTNGDPIGFFPFNEYNESKTCPHPNGVDWYHTTDQKKNNSYYNHGFGLTMSGTFQIPKGGKVNNENMIFSFSGDDDMWVFIDDVLVLDIGGIHHPSSGKIDFTAGTVSVDNNVVGVSGNKNTINSQNGNKVTAKIADLFSAAGKTWNSNEYSSHTIKVFYLERGGIYSNCKITFNIPLTLGEGEATIVKKDADTGTSVDTGKLAGAKFGLWTTADCSGDPIATQTSGEDGKVTFSNLPVDTADRVYYMKEMVAPTGYVLSDEVFTLSVGTKGSDGVYSFVIKDSKNNTLTTIGQTPALPMITNRKNEITASKLWKQGAVTMDEEALKGVQVKLTLMKGGAAATSADTTSDITQIVSGNGTARWVMKSADTTGYTVKEVAVKLPGNSEFIDVGTNNAYGGAVTGDSQGGFTVTNEFPKAGFTILKVDQDDNAVKLKDAEFTLRKVSGTSPYDYEEDASKAVTQATGQDGTATFSDLSDGYYEVDETKLPAGYVNVGASAFYIQVSGGKVTLVEKSNGGWREVSSAEDGKFTFRAASASSSAAVTVRNKAGKELPHTGGPGTTALYMLGLLLAAGSSAVLWYRRRSPARHRE